MGQDQDGAGKHRATTVAITGVVGGEQRLAMTGQQRMQHPKTECRDDQRRHARQASVREGLQCRQGLRVKAALEADRPIHHQGRIRVQPTRSGHA